MIKTAINGLEIIHSRNCDNCCSTMTYTCQDVTTLLNTDMTEEEREKFGTDDAYYITCLVCGQRLYVTVKPVVVTEAEGE